MARVADYLQDEALAAVYTSPRSRALEGARMIAAARSCSFEVVAGFSEIHFGDFEGLSYDEIADRHPEIYRQWMETPTEVQFPNGESFSAMRTRVIGAFTGIQREHEGQTIAIVSHGGVNRVLIAWALGMPDDCLFRLAQDYAAVNLITFTCGFPCVQLLNYSVQEPV
jgi:alpha-ribazole phosphatase/probable phosphoglycerate mutase